MANRDVFPTANWQWPDPTQVSGAANAARVQADEATQLRRDRDDWKLVAERRMKERDELMEALVELLPMWRMELENEGPGQVDRLLADVERWEALIARIKGGGCDGSGHLAEGVGRRVGSADRRVRG